MADTSQYARHCIGVQSNASFARAGHALALTVKVMARGSPAMNFDFSKPNSKFIAGDPLTIPNGAGPGMDLILSPGEPIPDPAFPAHANCKKFA